jgi:hypothetical protein
VKGDLGQRAAFQRRPGSAQVDMEVVPDQDQDHGPAGQLVMGGGEQARRHRCTDRSDTRSPAAISAAGTRCSNFSTAASRTSSRRRRPSAVNRRPARTSYSVHTAGNPACQPHRHRQLKIG